MSVYNETVIKLTKLIEQYPDIPNAIFNDDEAWEITSIMYHYPKVFALKWGVKWNYKVTKMTLKADKTKNLEWITQLFPNLIHLNLIGSAKIKSLSGLEKLKNLKVLSLEKLSNWKNLSELKPIKGLRKLIFEVNSKYLQINLNELPESISELYFGPNKLEDLLFEENLDFNRFKNLTILTIIASQLGNGSSVKLPSTLKEFSIYRNNSFNDLSMLSTLQDDCKIAIRSLHLSKILLPKEFINIKIIPYN